MTDVPGEEGDVTDALASPHPPPEAGSVVAGTDLERIGDEHAALRRVAACVTGDASPEAVFQTVAVEVGRLLDSNFAIIRRFELGRRVRDVAMWTNSQQPHPPLTSEAVALGGHNLSTMVFETGEIAQIDGYGKTAGAAGAAAIAAGVRSAVGAPIKVHGVLWGVMVASATVGAPVTPEVGRRLQAFTDLVATAIANAEARDELRRLANAQSALRRVATLIAGSAAPREVLSAVAQEVRDLLDADAAAIFRFEITGGVNEVAEAGAVAAGTKRQMLRTADLLRRSDDISAGAVPAQVAHTVVEGEGGRLCSVATPIVVNGEVWGAVAVSKSGEAAPRRVEERLVEFTRLVAIAIVNAEDRTELLASRARIVAAADAARRRIERDLHDGVQQRILALALSLRRTEKLVPPELPEIRRSFTRTVDGLSEILEELREISRGIHPAVLTQGGLRPALRSLARRSTVPTKVSVRMEERVAQDVEVAAYYVVAEALANVVKHAKAKAVHVEAYVDSNSLRLRVYDDGVGGAEPQKGSGILGLSDRVHALGGTFRLESAPGEGTALSASLPLT